MGTISSATRLLLSPRKCELTTGYIIQYCAPGSGNEEYENINTMTLMMRQMKIQSLYMGSGGEWPENQFVEILIEEKVSQAFALVK